MLSGIVCINSNSFLLFYFPVSIAAGPEPSQVMASLVWQVTLYPDREGGEGRPGREGGAAGSTTAECGAVRAQRTGN